MDINLLTEAETASLRHIITAAGNIVICCHKSPDGDAIGSSLGLARFLQTMGKQPAVVVPDAFPDFLHWMPGTEGIVRHDKQRDRAEALLAQADVVFCLDFNTTSRVADMQQALDATPARRVLIDHHLTPDIGAVLTVSHPEMSSTSEIVFRLIWQMGGFGQMDASCAAAIYCGMMTDTGGFTYNSNSPAIFFIISQLLTKGIDKDKIYRNVFNNYSQWAIRFRGYLMSERLYVMPQLHASFFSISKSEMRRFHFIKGDVEGLVNEPLRIKGMKLSVSLREDDRHDNTVWVSLRSVDDFPCNRMAAEFFNGGGHLNASGGHLDCSLAQAIAITKQAIQHYAHLLQ